MPVSLTARRVGRENRFTIRPGLFNQAKAYLMRVSDQWAARSRGCGRLSSSRSLLFRFGPAPPNGIGILFSASWFERDFLQVAFQDLRTYRVFLQQSDTSFATRGHTSASYWVPKAAAVSS